MHIQQVHQRRVKVTGSDGQSRIETRFEPATDATTLHHDGRDYETEGNGVFNVPDELGQQLLGGLFRDVSGVRGAPLDLSEAHRAKRPKGQRDDAHLYEASEALEGALEASDVGERAEGADEEVEPPEGLKAAKAAKKA